MNTTLDQPSPAQTATEGSTLYYALLYIDDAAAQRSIDTLRFIDTLSSALHDVTEPQVAEKKIHWWHEELARLAKRDSRHPDCVSVQPYLYGAVDVRASLNVLSASSGERYTPLKSDSELVSAIQDDYSARLRLLDTALGTNSRDDTRNAIALGLGLFDRLNALVSLLRSGYAVFSDERYAAHSLKPDALLRYSNEAIATRTGNAEPGDTEHSKDTINAFLTDALHETSDALQAAISSIDSSASNTALPIQIMCRIRYAQVQLWKKRNINVLEESMSLTPLRKFFIAYRCKRRFMKATKQVTKKANA